MEQKIHVFLKKFIASIESSDRTFPFRLSG